MTGFSQSEKKFTIMKYPIKSMDDQDTIDIMVNNKLIATQIVAVCI